MTRFFEKIDIAGSLKFCHILVTFKQEQIIEESVDNLDDRWELPTFEHSSDVMEEDVYSFSTERANYYLNGGQHFGKSRKSEIIPETDGIVIESVSYRE